MADEDGLPPPPKQKPSGLALEEELLSIWRLHRDPDALKARHHERGISRFDAPAGQYPALYGNASRLGCFAEVYGDTGRIGTSEGENRYLSHIQSKKPVKVLALDEGSIQKVLGLDARICVLKQYETTRRWALEIYRWFPEAAGIRYISRHAAPNLNYCLFLNRCRPALQADLEGPLKDLRSTVLLAASRYRLDSQIAWR